jgi:hypothetical protein
MDDEIKTQSEVEEEIFPSNSLMEKYREFVCVIPGFGVYIPFISTRDALTTSSARSMIMGTLEREFYEN